MCAAVPFATWRRKAVGGRLHGTLAAVREALAVGVECLREGALPVGRRCSRLRAAGIAPGRPCRRALKPINRTGSFRRKNFAPLFCRLWASCTAHILSLTIKSTFGNFGVFQRKHAIISIGAADVLVAGGFGCLRQFFGSACVIRGFSVIRLQEAFFVVQLSSLVLSLSLLKTQARYFPVSFTPRNSR